MEEPGMVPAAREIDATGFLPGADLNAIVRRRFAEKRQRLADVVAGPESVVDGPEVEGLKIDGVESEGIDAADGVEKRQVRPRAFPELVGVVVNEPAGVELARQLRLSQQDAFPLETRRRRSVARRR